MKEAAARELRTCDLVTWSWDKAGKQRAMPGTVTGNDQQGVLIYWQDSADVPTHYDYGDQGAWENIEQHFPERTYHAVPKTRPPRRKRKKASR